MNRVATVLVFAAAFAFGGGSTCQKPTPTNPVVGGVINCAEAGVHEAALHIIDDAASALATGEYVDGLLTLVKRFGEGAVDCAVAEIAGTSEKHAAMDSLEAEKAKRANAWLASRPVTLSGLCWPGGCAGDDDFMMAPRGFCWPPGSSCVSEPMVLAGQPQPGLCPHCCCETHL